MADPHVRHEPGLPVIDMAPLFASEPGPSESTARRIADACRRFGFFYVTGHGIPQATLAALEAASRRFFALPDAVKTRIAMVHGGAAWRGYFPVGGELTSGRPDVKEGLYFGTELAVDDERVKAGWPLHGPNLWPAEVPELRDAVNDYMAGATRAGHALAAGLSLSLGLAADYFERHYTAEPTILFRIFRYPARPPEGGDFGGSWGVGEHTDYGLLTLMHQDRHGGLEVRSPAGWLAAPPVPGTLVCNIGDMLERLTEGRYVSTPHRVQNLSGADRLSFPLFFDPDFAAEIRPLPAEARPAATAARWDGADLYAFEGTYGEYLMAKVGKVFPELGAKVL